MRKFNKKQRMLVICVCIIFIGGIVCYICVKNGVNHDDGLFLYENSAISEENIFIDNVLDGERTKDTKQESDEVTVYITGAVNKPGVYTLPRGSRIIDAVEKAEGLREDANTEEVNLAYVIEDGMQITFSSKKDIKINSSNVKTGVTTDSGLNRESANGVNNSESSQKISEKININTATQEQLETLTGIGSATAKKIIQYRKEKGNFKSIDDIKNVSGIGESKYNKIKDKICVK